MRVAAVTSINVTALRYDFTVFRATSTPDGKNYASVDYVTTSLTSSLTFGGPNNTITAATFQTATNLNSSVILSVNAGDRIGIRVRTLKSTDPSAADITQLSFSASISYTQSP